jgi:DsbC/DsbD-like thiol-disulfide interchange protein
MSSGILVTASSLILSVAITPASARVVHTDHAEVELVSQLASVAPGDSFKVALRLVPEDGWYVYWSNPGDAGMPPSLDWDLPHGFSAGAIGFTAPERIEHPPFASFGYTSEVWFPLWMHVAPDALPGTQELTARAEWLICSDECIPESARLSLTVEVGDTRPDADRAAEWQNVLARMPVDAPDWGWHVIYGDNTIQLRWTLPPDHAPLDRVAFFPAEQGIIENGASQRLDMEGNQAVLTLERDPLILAQPGAVEGVAVRGHDGLLHGVMVQSRVTPTSEPIR